MADEDFQSKTEAPTQRRREEARRQGQVAFSMDLAGAVQLLVAVVVLAASGVSLGQGFLELARHDLGGVGLSSLDPRSVQERFAFELGSAGRLIGVLLGVLFVAGLAVGLLQTGFLFTPELLTLHWERLSLAAGFGRFFSLATVVRALTSLLKIALVAALAYWVIKGRVTQIAFLSEATLKEAVARVWDLAMRLATATAGGLVLVGLVDYGYQRFRLERSLRMTRQELNEEIKREEGNPQIKARVRRLQREMAQRRMLREVPKATVVITNPTHLAVALRYDWAKMTSPRLVAKGAGFVAARIIEEARRHQIPIVQRPPLAQALHHTVKIGQEIPAELYYVVAEVLAYVYRLRGMV